MYGLYLLPHSSLTRLTMKYDNVVSKRNVVNLSSISHYCTLMLRYLHFKYGICLDSRYSTFRLSASYASVFMLVHLCTKHGGALKKKK